MPGRILVVDDMLPNIKLLEAKLASEYYEILTAFSGIEAIEKAEKESPDLILLDVMMPDLDGFETCRRLKGNPLTQHIPVVMVTALSDSTDRVRGLEAGADEFLTKPVRDLPLFARVRSLIRLKTLMDAYRIREATSTEFGALKKDLLGVAVVKGASVAVLADDNLTQMSLKRILEKDQHRITPFGTVEELQEGIPGGNFDILIVPLRLKGEDMLRSCVALRNNEKSRQLPILLMAEEEDEPILAKALELGLNAYILRPIDQHELRARVATQVRRLRYQERLRNTYEMSINLALTDELTGLYNRRYFNAHLDSLLAQAEKEHKSTTVLILDIDFFKKINDTYGHDEGDKVLVDVAKRLMRSVRDADLVARLGGEEFVAVLPDTRTGIGLQVAERLRRSMEGTPFSLLSGQEIPVTISIGMACTRNEADLDRHRMLKVADEALYKAKRSGRNRVVVGSFAATSVASMGKDKAVS